MDYTSILQELNKASLFDLHRLQSAIYQELLNPERIEQIKARLKAGAKVDFKNKYNNDIFGEVIRLNPKTATIRIGEHDEWLVPYRGLFYVIDGELGDLKEQTFIPRDL